MNAGFHSALEAIVVDSPLNGGESCLYKQATFKALDDGHGLEGGHNLYRTTSHTSCHHHKGLANLQVHFKRSKSRSGC
jgi:hypothetical protein